MGTKRLIVSKHASAASQHHTKLIAGQRRAAFTLAEMTISLAIVAMISAVCGSAMVFATRSIQSNYVSPGAGLSVARNASDWMSDDLKVSTGFTEQTSTAVTMLVPDRTGDGTPETVRYAWSGSTGSTIKGFSIPAWSVTREFNGSNPTLLVSNAKSFGLTYNTREVGPQAPEESAESVLAWHEGAADTNEVLMGLDDHDYVCQSFKPLLLHNAQSWKMTKVRLKLQRYASAGTVTVDLRATDSSGLASGGALGSVTASVASLPAATDWVTLTFTNPISNLDLNTSYALVVSAKPGHANALAYVARDTAAGDTSQLSATSDKPDKNWNGATSSMALQFYVYGTQTTQDPN